MAQDEKIVAEDVRLEELKKKADRSEEETKELGTLEDGKKTRYQKRIDELTWKSKTAQEELETEREERIRMQVELDELKKAPPKEEKIVEDTVEIGGKKYYTDEALASQVRAGSITEAKAYKYQRDRDRQEDRLAIINDLTKGKKEKDVEDERKIDAEGVLKDYPHFSKKDPNFNPEDPLYKLATELWSEAYVANPKGLSKAIKRAKEILKISDTHIDRSDDLGVEDSRPADKKVRKEKQDTLSEDEKDAAIKMYTKGDVLNPKTGRAYTVNEALVTALEAKKERQ